MKKTIKFNQLYFQQKYLSIKKFLISNRIFNKIKNQENTKIINFLTIADDRYEQLLTIQREISVLTFQQNKYPNNKINFIYFDLEIQEKLLFIKYLIQDFCEVFLILSFKKYSLRNIKLLINQLFMTIIVRANYKKQIKIMVDKIKIFNIFLILIIALLQQRYVECQIKAFSDRILAQYCDQMLIEQLEQQNISYQCQNTVIFIQNLDTIELELQIKDHYVYSPIYINNANYVKIKQLIISDSSFKFIDYFISLRNINRLEIGLFKVSNMQKQDFINLMEGYTIKDCLIDQLQISSQEGFDDYYSIRIKSDLLAIGEIYIQNIFNIFSQLNGQNQLSVNEIFISQNINPEKLENFSNFQMQYLSNQSILINILSIEVNNIQNVQKLGEQKFAYIEILTYDKSEISEIIVKQISYTSSQTKFQNYGIVQFKTEQRKTLISLNSIQYQQIDSQYYLQIQMDQFFECLIHKITIQNFGNSLMESQYQNSLFKLKYINKMGIESINFKQNCLVNGTLINGSVDQFEIFQLQVEQFVTFQQTLLELQNSQLIKIINLNIENCKINGYLFNLKNIFQLFCINASLNKIQFSQKSLFYLQNVNYLYIDKVQLKNFETFQQQSAILQIQSLDVDHENTIQFESIIADLKTNKNLQFLNFYGILSQIQIQSSQIINGSSINFGGCLNFQFDEKQKFQNIVLQLSSTVLNQCQSKYLGGAVSGISLSQLTVESKIINSSSNISGGIYQLKPDNQQNQDIFFNNTGYLTSNNYNKQSIEVKIENIYEINLENDDARLLITIDDYLYPGLKYLIRIAIKVDGEWYQQYSEQSFFGNIYDLIVDPSDNYIAKTPPKLQKINYPFILWYAENVEFDAKQTIDFKLNNINLVKQYSLDTKQYKLFHGCKDQGMEKVYLEKNNKQQFVCRYCENMKAGYQGTCQICQADLFSECYGNYSKLREPYWRSSFTIDPAEIFYCSNNPQNCIGGSGAGNELCYQGHVGPQCLDCDIRGAYWGEKYSSAGFFQCSFKLILLLFNLLNFQI
ncbi:transmembrane protein, putative (macronuclear) [Tetrahymena thermophila SB210]|uniref:Transmembrane protein, putative n=1 Tax=Tetrahymena thermophila (strain SB210) TaxID=312017 RepID=I7M783_TETTS|nr:transmembrane protein, putative [Tetrahymena thermophila SB210]EAR90743.2 transmembrane protein, putative [Tetrahymena thermophila SB210]|eukprot:XP_001010988.2 transmembrane protein, putative [Tetrahymena thermophila SB210]